MARKSQKDKISDFLKTAQQRLKWEVKADAHNREAAIECLNFLLPGGQWSPAEKADRKNEGRPCIEINLLNKYIAQLVGEMLHNRARVSLKPADALATPGIANIRRGIVADTEYRSNSEDIYLEAGKSLVGCGYGAWRTNTRWCEDNPFVQEMYDELIPNPFNVYLDSRRKDQAGADAQYGFILCKMTNEEFKEKWPEAQVPWDTLAKMGRGQTNELWYTSETVTVAEYFILKPEKQTLLQLEDGTVCNQKEFDDLHQEWEEKQQEAIAAAAKAADAVNNKPAVQAHPVATQAPGMMPPGDTPMPQPPALPTLPPNGAQPNALQTSPMPQPKPEPKIAHKRVTEINKVKHYTITAAEILENKKAFDDLEDHDPLDGEAFPGRYIPIVLVSGPTINIEGKVYRKGLVRDAMDAQRLVNYWETALAEMVALAPKAPWLGTAKQFEGNEEAYRTANVKNFPFLTYKPDHDDKGTLLPPPMRQAPGQAPIALFQQVARAHHNVEEVMGMFGPDVGEVGPERTGAAVYAKQKPGDISTFVYSYNLTRAIEHSGKIKNEIIPEIIDTERDVRLRNVDDTETIVPVNTTAEAALNSIKQNPQRYKGVNTTPLVQLLQQQGKNAKYNDLRMGRYDVVVTTGPSYATQRQETAVVLQNMMTSMPKQVSQVLPILFENLDFKDADRCASIFRRLAPPGLFPLKENEVPYKPPMQPQVMALMQKAKTEQQKEKTAQAKEQVALLTARVKLVELYKELKESDHEVRKQVLTILAEVTALAHPADQLMLQQGQGGEG